MLLMIMIRSLELAAWKRETLAWLLNQLPMIFSLWMKHNKIFDCCPQREENVWDEDWTGRKEKKENGWDEEK